MAHRRRRRVSGVIGTLPFLQSEKRRTRPTGTCNLSGDLRQASPTPISVDEVLFGHRDLMHAAIPFSNEPSSRFEAPRRLACGSRVSHADLGDALMDRP